jgi:hypothetical protein
VIGIHKGYDPKEKKDVCVLLDKDIIRQLRIWMEEMSLMLKVQ